MPTHKATDALKKKGGWVGKFSPSSVGNLNGLSGDDEFVSMNASSG